MGWKETENKKNEKKDQRKKETQYEHDLLIYKNLID